MVIVAWQRGGWCRTKEREREDMIQRQSLGRRGVVPSRTTLLYFWKAVVASLACLKTISATPTAVIFVDLSGPIVSKRSCKNAAITTRRPH